MARRARTRRRLEPEIRRQELVEAAERLLRRDGPGVRVEDVVREAAAAKGTFYVYFPAWDDLLEAIRSRATEAFDKAFPVPVGTGSDVDWPRLVERLAVAFVDGVAGMGELHTVLFHSDFAQRRPLSDDDNPVSRLIAIVRAGREAGAFADVDAHLVGRFLFAVIHEAADAVAAGEDRKRALAAMRWILRRVLESGVR